MTSLLITTLPAPKDTVCCTIPICLLNSSCTSQSVKLSDQNSSLVIVLSLLLFLGKSQPGSVLIKFVLIIKKKCNGTVHIGAKLL